MGLPDRKSTRLNSSHLVISYAVFCLKKKNVNNQCEASLNGIRRATPSLKVLYCCAAGFFFFFNDTATTEIYTLSLHDALPISIRLQPLPKRHWLHCGNGPSNRRGCMARRATQRPISPSGSSWRVWSWFQWT